MAGEPYRGWAWVYRHAAALAYAEAGIHVFPARVGGLWEVF
jgi:hypothetical protein